MIYLLKIKNIRESTLMSLKIVTIPASNTRANGEYLILVQLFIGLCKPTVRMAWAYSSTQMERGTREPSKMAYFMAGARCRKPMETYTWGNGRMIRQQAKERSLMLLRVSDTKVSG